MTGKTKKILAVLLSFVMIVAGIPFVSVAAETGTLTIKTNTTAENVEIDSNIAFSYEVKINDELFSGKAQGDDGNDYNVKSGVVTIPYGVSAVITSIPAGSSYSVKRLAYDNEKYALVDESEVQSGKVAENSYFVSVNGEEEKAITAGEYDEGTQGGTVTEYKVYKDSEGNVYSEEDIDYIGGYTSINDTTSGNYAYLKSSLESHKVIAEVNYGTVTESGSFIKTRTAKASYTFSCDGFETVTGNVTGTSKTGKDAARSDAANNIAAAFTEYAESCFNVIESSGKKTVYDKHGDFVVLKGGYLLGGFSWTGDNTTASSEVEISAFTPTDDITSYAYRIEYGEADKKAEFDVNLLPAPTGSFQINFALDDTVPSGYDNAVFEIKDSNGNFLTEGEDYTLEKKPFSLEEISKGVLKWGLTIYTFSGIKAGTYSVSQKSTANGYKFDDTAEYEFTVARKDGAVTGESFDTCEINKNIPCLYNADKSIDLKLFKIKLFLYMNESFSLSFNVKDQNGEAVEGSQFMMVERDALISLVTKIASLGVNNIGNIDISEIIGSVGSLDFSNMDAGTILSILETVLDLIPELPEGTKLPIPAILMASSDENGLVNFKNASNMMNALDTIAKIGDGVDAESVAETIKNLVGSTIPEEYLDTLVKLAKYTSVLEVHTGIPAAYFVLFNSSAPEGYERNAVMYTIKVGNDGNATTSAGILIPVIADVISERFDIDIYDILINEEEFNNASAAVKDAFGTFSEYSTFVIDLVGSFIEDDIGGIITKDQLEEFKDNIYEMYQEYDNLSEAIGEAVQNLNNSIKSDLTEDWTYTNNRYFLTVDVDATDCKGNEVSMKLVDSEGTEWYIASSKAILPYGTYTFTLTQEGDYELIENSSDYVLVINDHNAKYAVTYKYHLREAVERVEPDCENTGLEAGIDCALCGTHLVEQAVIPALGHTPVVDEEIPATCTESGLAEGSHCEVCGKVLVKQEVIEPLGHTEVPIGEFILPTCEEDGITDGVKCAVCGEILEAREVLDNHGHFPAGDFESIIPATCTEGGKDADFVCWICGELIAEGAPTEPLGHEEETDDAVAPSCTETGLTEGSHCPVCGEVLVEQKTVEALGHTEVPAGEAKQPTCTEEGLTAGIKCSVCGEILEAQKVIEKLPHTPEKDEALAPTCTSTGLSEGTHCSVCGEVLKAQKVLDKAPHDFVTNVILPTEDEEGCIYKYCTVCDEQVIISVLGPTEDDGSLMCRHYVAGICKTYNKMYNKPLLGFIITICHDIVHYFHK